MSAATIAAVLFCLLVPTVAAYWARAIEAVEGGKGHSLTYIVIVWLILLAPMLWISPIVAESMDIRTMDGGTQCENMGDAVNADPDKVDNCTTTWDWLGFHLISPFGPAILGYGHALAFERAFGVEHVYEQMYPPEQL
jgi:hypothetical protein